MANLSDSGVTLPIDALWHPERWPPLIVILRDILRRYVRPRACVVGKVTGPCCIVDDEENLIAVTVERNAVEGELARFVIRIRSFRKSGGELRMIESSLTDA